MKSSNMLFLLAVATVTFSFNIESALLPSVTDGVVDLDHYLFGEVDSNGQTALHRIVSNCDNDDFTVRLRLFDFLENAEQSEGFKALKERRANIEKLPQDLAQFAALMEANDFIQKKDNNGDTALDIAKKRNALNPHKRCDICINLLEASEKFHAILNQNIAQK